MYRNLLECTEKYWNVHTGVKSSGMYRKVLESIEKYRNVQACKKMKKSVQECTELY